jgi:hypothetical protein
MRGGGASAGDLPAVPPPEAMRRATGLARAGILG